ncbi:hypothetical protein [Sphaerisporangium aureirubrum]|uniref:Uncharacterized protein n=1 Tax=Sphaerisporangium aureirubrum TaxID=1544736 RepID=A0ABW1NGT4_9ACTN
MRYADDFLGAIQDLLGSFGLDVSLVVLRRIFWILAGVLLLYGAAKLIHSFLSAAGSVFGFARRRVQERFWRETDKMAPLISLLLLVIAYAFYGREQTRTLPEALLDLGKEQLASVLPLAIVTQWVLLCAFWLVFGLLLGVTRERLMYPLSSMLFLAVLTGYMILFTTALMGVFADGVQVAEAGVFALAVPLMYLGNVLDGPERRARHARMREEMRAEAGLPEVRRGAAHRLIWGSADRPGSRWLPPPGPMLGGVLAVFVMFALLTGVIYALKAFGEPRPPTVAEVVHAELVVTSLLFLLSCFYFRTVTLMELDPPPALFHFVDLSLALSACAVAVAGLPDSAVTLGPVPPWVVAMGPSLVVAALILGIHLREQRAGTPRWGICLAVSVAAAVLVWPAKIVLTEVLPPLIGLLPLPGWLPVDAGW